MDNWIEENKDFIRWLGLYKRPLTVKQYVYILNKFISSGMTVLQYANTIADRKMFLTQFRASVMAYGKYCRGKGERDIYSQIINELDYIYTHRLSSQIPKTLNDDEKSLVIDRIKYIILHFQSDYNSKVPFMIIAFLYYAGLRINECINLKRGYITTKEGVKIIMIPREIGKGGKERIVAMSNTLIELYSEFTKDIPANQDYLFLKPNGQPFKNDSARYRVKQAEKIIGLSRYVNPHLFRHTFATDKINKGVALPTLQAIMGHTSIATTGIYLHSSFKDQKEAVNK